MDNELDPNRWFEIRFVNQLIGRHEEGESKDSIRQKVRAYVVDMAALLLESGVISRETHDEFCDPEFLKELMLNINRALGSHELLTEDERLRCREHLVLINHLGELKTLWYLFGRCK